MQIKLNITIDCGDVPTREQLECAIDCAERVLEQELKDVLVDNNPFPIETEITVPVCCLTIG